MAGTNGNGNGNGGAPKVGTDTVKQGLAQMLKGGVIVSWPSLIGFFVGGFGRQELRLSTICTKGKDCMPEMCWRRIFFVPAKRWMRCRSELPEECSLQPRRSLLFSASCVRLAGLVSLAGFTEISAISDDDG